MRWAIPRARVPSGEAVGGSQSLQATLPAAAYPPTASALLFRLEFPEGLKREVDCVPRAPGGGREDTFLRPLLRAKPCAGASQLFSADPPPLWCVLPPVHLPRGRNTLPQWCMTPDHRLNTEGLLEGGQSPHCTERMPRPTEPPSRVTERPAPSFPTLCPVLSPPCSGPALSRTGSLLFCVPAPVARTRAPPPRDGLLSSPSLSGLPAGPNPTSSRTPDL